MIELKRTQLEDLEDLFEFQTDERANLMAAFGSKDPKDKSAYIEKWSKIVVNPEMEMHSIFFNEKLVGSVIHFEMMGEVNVSYWIDRNYWDKGIASNSLRIFLNITKKRPLFGRTVFDNIGSQKVLEKCGFVKIGTELGFANARKMEVEEFVYRLD